MSLLNDFLKGQTFKPSNAKDLTKEYFLGAFSYQDKVSFIDEVTKSLIDLLYSKSLSADERINVAENIEDLLQFLASFHSVNTKESQYKLRSTLFHYYTQGGDIVNFSQAAEILSNASLDGLTLTANQKVDHYLKCAEAFLLDEVVSSAETCARKANSFLVDIENTPEGPALSLRLRVTLARVMDSNRKFSEAASRFYELSTTTNVKIIEEELLTLFGKAVICAILAKAGPYRSRLLNLLHSDSRLHKLEQLPEFALAPLVLIKMKKKQLVMIEELEGFEKLLEEHQRAMGSDGITVFQRACLEHNLLSLSGVYESVKLSELEHIVGGTSQQVFKLTSTMITEGRLKAVIDQVSGILHLSPTQDPVSTFQDVISDICQEINNVTSIFQ